ncbi:MAG: proprotein convertase P-domain-containing protein [Saprospiraceae bacterium]|nr:proprotein convertase P-domain-containing protein [Saprospiraceae bacterium]
MILLHKESIVNQEIPDRGGLTDSIHIHHNVEIVALRVGLDIEHPFIGDLKVVLTSPSGTTATLHNRAGGNADNIKHVYEGKVVAGFVGQSVAGEWKLTVQDFAPRDSGSLKSWRLEVDCAQGNASEVFIPEGSDAWLVSEQVCNQSGIIEDVHVHVNIEHPFINDIVAKLVSPSGEAFLLHNRQGGSADNIDKIYGLEVLGGLKGTNTQGTWALHVKDFAPRDSGTLKAWKIAFSYQQIDNLAAVVSAEQAAILNSNGIHSFNKLSTLGTADLRALLAGTEGDHSIAGLNGILDAAKTA